MFDFIYWIFIGIAAGYLAGKIYKGKNYGWKVNMIVGVAGALLGGIVFGLLGIEFGMGMFGELLAAFLGSIGVIWLIHKFNK